MDQVLAVFKLPIKIESNANLREHWAVKMKRSKMQRMAAAYAVAFQHDWGMPDGRFTVKLVRVGRRLLDDDNLSGGFKAVRDGVADALGMNDNDPRVTWEYAQEIGREYSCRIEMLVKRARRKS